MQRKFFTLTLLAAVLALAAGKLAAADKAVATPTADKAAKTVEVKPSQASEAKPSPTPAAKDSKDSDDSKPAEVNHKSPALAGTLAFIPGIAIHGVGHMYAGSWVKGLGLFAIGSAGAGVAAYQGVTGYNDIQKLFNNSNSGTVPEDLSPAYSRVGIILVGTVAFLFTWWDDMAGAPIAAQEYNKRADAAATRAELNVLPTSGGAQLVYTARF